MFTQTFHLQNPKHITTTERCL